ncbi:hypothetical protein D9613_007866 [Agrocybe pediades]|uniref:Meiotically up-regulated gene 190 protein n=1 Tax=Agrocybe pediades TaxID=84607 RepID=A0A8H4QMX6_9AGAR|nr:hypothetical protein D9613_007866 [Agrocybe pediades]KAF9561970.1 hypothetical protein CPC08DRAFT_688303 [Agrocybe pediades]
MSEPNGPGSNDKNPTKHNEHQVTDPVTHLPLTIHDADQVELERIPPPPSTIDEKKIREQRGADTKEETNARHSDMEDVVEEMVHGKWWEDPIGDQRRTRTQTSAVAAVSAALGSFASLVLWSLTGKLFGSGDGRMSWFSFFLTPFMCCFLGIGVGAVSMSLGLYQHRPDPLVESQIKENHDPHKLEKATNKDETSPESAEWLNAFLHSVWPVVNPALFTSVADMLEDAMQVTLPKLVHGVRVADIGQGSESVRILGIRWLDAGSAAKDVDGMKAEEGDFVNMEIAMAYRAKETTSKGIRGRSANAHLLMEFFVSGGVMIPVWVDLTGFLATMRVRFQLTPNPPFLSLMTLTLLGLPKVTLKCTPLAKGFLNVMDIPGLSNWIQSSINLAVQEYVAPKSLTMDLKTLLMGREKMDTDAVGVVVVTICNAEGFKDGDGGKILKSSEGQKGDVYVTIGWSKWGKPLWSSRVVSSGHPIWEETMAFLVGPSELNAQEELQIQLWDSDRFTADDLLGEVEVPLHDLMSSDQSHNRMSIRDDELKSEKGDRMPGKLHWECGYFPKTTFDQHLANKKHKDAQEIREKIEAEAEKKLREAKARDDQAEDGEVQQQKKEDMKEKSDEIIAGTKPTEEWPSGILSVRIEQIDGLELIKVRETGVKEDAEDSEDGDLPSAYCTIIINHQRVYKTRTKMKSNNPFYDAGTEKFVRDWTNTEVVISVRDSRIHELDPVIGIVVLPLPQLFRHSSQFTGSLPLVGGTGYGRMRLSLTFRSVQLKLPKRLLGWDVGTLEISSNAKPDANLQRDYSSCRLVFQTVNSKGKMVPNNAGNGWVHKRGRPIRLAVTKRYASCLLIKLRKRVVGPDLTPAFATLWFKDIPDNEEVTVTLPVRRNADNSLAASRANASMEIGEQIGTLELTVRMWPGLSGYHKHMADHNKNMADVMEVLDYAEGEQETSMGLLEGDYESDSGSSSDSASSSGEENDGGREAKAHAHPDDSSDTAVERSSTSSSSPRKRLSSNLADNDGIVGQFNDFRKNRGELHRKHRGLMQWKPVRNVAWIGRGVEDQAARISNKVKGTFKHQERDVGGIEKEYEM